MKTKLTLVSIGYRQRNYRQRKIAIFVKLPVVGGKVQLNDKTFHQICRDHGIKLLTGSTYTIGG